MTEKLKDILSCRDILVPKMLFFNYSKIGITSDELIFLVYLINIGLIFNPKKICDDIGMSLNNVMECMDSLSSKGIIKVEMKKNGNIRNEVVNLEGLYDKLSCLLIDEEKEEKTTIYDEFISEFGRSLSPIECQIIGAWLDNNYSEEIILLALKDATYNGVRNLRYIDKILSEWSKNGIKNAADVEKNRVNYKKKKAIPATDILNYDWLNDE